MKPRIRARTPYKRVLKLLSWLHLCLHCYRPAWNTALYCRRCLEDEVYQRPEEREKISILCDPICPGCGLRTDGGSAHLKCMEDDPKVFDYVLRRVTGR